jgi:DNA-binding MarR family transcriptional regulator
MKPRESLAFGVAVMARLFDRELRATFAEFGVLPGQLPVLLELYDRDGQTQAELARALTVEQPTMASTLGRMERAGLVHRLADAADRRRAGVWLTEYARRIERPLIDAARAVNRKAVRGLSADERAALYRAVNRATKNLDSSQPRRTERGSVP